MRPPLCVSQVRYMFVWEADEAAVHMRHATLPDRLRGRNQISVPASRKGGDKQGHKSAKFYTSGSCNRAVVFRGEAAMTIDNAPNIFEVMLHF